MDKFWRKVTQRMMTKTPAPVATKFIAQHRNSFSEYTSPIMMAAMEPTIP